MENVFSGKNDSLAVRQDFVLQNRFENCWPDDKGRFSIAAADWIFSKQGLASVQSWLADLRVLSAFGVQPKALFSTSKTGVERIRNASLDEL